MLDHQTDDKILKSVSYAIQEASKHKWSLPCILKDSALSKILRKILNNVQVKPQAAIKQSKTNYFDPLSECIKIVLD